MQKLPIGIQTFSEIRNNNYIYVDKTGLAYELVKQHKYVFLSRPRRFGKSLFLDTLKSIFEGDKELFNGLAIENKWDWNIKYPVIRIDFSKGRNENRQDLDKAILRILEVNQQALGIEELEDKSISGGFEELIIKTYKRYNQRVVILIDEYDKSILDNITDASTVDSIRKGLVNLYSVIKGSDIYLRFVFITGVSKFAKTSIFSGLNNIEDVSLNPKFGAICGYTQEDLETTFKEQLAGADMQAVKEWYDGYNFLGTCVYNPFAILLFIRNELVFKNYWFETGTPSFLIELIQKNKYFLPNLTNLRADSVLLSSFDINKLDLEVILYQAGYLTIDTVKTSIFGTPEYTLRIPNKEVKLSLNDSIIDYLIQDPRRIENKTNIYKSLLEQDIAAFKTALSAMFASIPYNNYTSNSLHKYEGFYASVIYVYLQSFGIDIIGEDVTNKGRIDLTLKLKEVIYILEFKVVQKNSSTQEALEQIKAKGYAEKYSDLNKPIYLLGIHFDPEEKNVSQLDWEKWEE